MVLTASDAVSILSYLILTVALTGVEVTLYDMILSARRKNWLWRVPFSALFFFAQFVLKWDVMIPFYVMGQFAVGVTTTKDRFEQMPKQRAAKPLLLSGMFSTAYLIIALITGVRA